jgi:5-hydroxyisourate hydrolase
MTSAAAASPITTHVLDTSRGAPAAGIAVTLERDVARTGWASVGAGVTDADGRLRTLAVPGSLLPGAYRITFDVDAYFRAQRVTSFWRHVAIEFVVRDTNAHYHVPLLVSPFGYSTYRGS